MCVAYRFILSTIAHFTTLSIDTTFQCYSLCKILLHADLQILVLKMGGGGAHFRLFPALTLQAVNNFTHTHAHTHTYTHTHKHTTNHTCIFAQHIFNWLMRDHVYSVKPLLVWNTRMVSRTDRGGSNKKSDWCIIIIEVHNILIS